MCILGEKLFPMNFKGVVHLFNNFVYFIKHGSNDKFTAFQYYKKAYILKKKIKLLKKRKAVSRYQIVII